VRGPGGLHVHISSPNKGISRVALRWNQKFAETTLFLGDHWERGYGDLQWRHVQPERVMPWYFTAHDPSSGSTIAMGVKTAPSAICFWTADPSGITLSLDQFIKHDYSTWDAFGRWGFEIGAELTLGDWHWQDQTRTHAEVLLNWYTAMREAAGDAYLLGCNTIGHLAAGLFEIQRTGDDTSGRIWERTRKMGINTLAFRMPQHRAFFVADADCAAHTSQTPWEMDQQWLDLVARSGTALFISVNPVGITEEKKAAFGRAVRLALDGGDAVEMDGGIEPLDWLTNTCPERWRLGKQTKTYNWIEPSGAWPYQTV
jgi:hypothetical protein